MLRERNSDRGAEGEAERNREKAAEGRENGVDDGGVRNKVRRVVRERNGDRCVVGKSRRGKRKEREWNWK